MKVKDVLLRDPADHPLVNNGQARIADDSELAMQELEGELRTFVCEGQYAEGIQVILNSFLTDHSRTSQRAAWVSGFFGSGKSHLLKVLCHLWRDTRFSDGATARSLVPALPDEIKAQLRELDTEGRKGGGLVSAAGALPAGTTDQVRLTMLAVLLRGLGLPELYPQACFCLWLHEEGWFDRVKQAVAAAGKTFEHEINNLYVSGVIARALLALAPGFASSEAEARKRLYEQFPSPRTDISSDQFLRIVKDALRLAGYGGKPPCALLVLDEVQQYIGDSSERSVLVTETVEAISKQLDAQVMVVGAGQSALTEIPLLQKLMDRFTVRVTLSDNDVETVTRKVLLQKQPARLADVRRLLEDHAGEVSRQLHGTRIGERTEDHEVAADDYPLLPVRRRFWEACFRQIDAAGTQSQLRSQLRIIHDAVARQSPRGLGAVIPGDELFDALAPEMVNTGVLPRELNEKIVGLESSHGALARRIASLVFLIGRLPRAAGVDLGVRATAAHIADLLVDDLAGDNGKLRTEVAATLATLSRAGILLEVGDEYRLQTREGAEWDREFRTCQQKLSTNAAQEQIKREELLYAELGRVVGGIQLLQGASKVRRTLTISRDATLPAGDGESLVAWAQDGWSRAEKDVVAAARAAGTDDPRLFIHIPRQKADDLKRVIVESDAAQQTLEARGTPSTPAGQEARIGMQTRRDRAATERDRLIAEIVGNAKVFQGGGNEILLPSLTERLRQAADAGLVRLFPRFKDADHAAWELAIKRAKEGADEPFRPVGHAGPVERHPVAQQVLTTAGEGKTGTEVRRELRAAPFGWPQDAVDAALIALHRAQLVTAALNGTPVALGPLDQSRIPKAVFRVEHATLTVVERVGLRKLFGQLDIACKSGEETHRAPDFLRALLDLAHVAGGDPPLPAAPSTTDIEDLARLVGNEQLVALKERAKELEQLIETWKKRRDMATARRRDWTLLDGLAAHAKALPQAESALQQVAAIKAQRLLLEPSTPLPALLGTITELLRSEVTRLHQEFLARLASTTKGLEQDPSWARTSKAERESILADVGLGHPCAPAIGTADELLTHLRAKPLDTWANELDALAARAGRALTEAARGLKGQVRQVTIEPTTLESEADLEAWLGRQRERIRTALADGPVVIG
ncbi:BREX system P-loop protein BrxC [bacterium]|nr:BREX system P-loop protein BrxC [bacterium]